MIWINFGSMVEEAVRAKAGKGDKGKGRAHFACVGRDVLPVVREKRRIGGASDI